ncbi:hypothetical protein B0H13DRAFT_2088582 [Mycena leptocephala]|nr:hypothetical protein B0H13DRAFT_2088582 [Mycena leptocephala]
MGRMIRWSDSLCALAAGGRRLYATYLKCSGVVTFLHTHPHPSNVRLVKFPGVHGPPQKIGDEGWKPRRVTYT